VVYTGGINPDTFYPALSGKKLRRLARDAREMQVGRISWLISAEILLLVRPESSPSGAHKHDGIIGNLSILLLPHCYIFRRQSIVRISFTGRRDVDHNRRADQMGERDFIYRHFPFAKMDG